MSKSRIENTLTGKVIEAIKDSYDQIISPNQITFQKTKKEFEGDITLLAFPLTKASKKSPEETAEKIGEQLKKSTPEIKSFNVVKGFLNLVIDESYWLNFFYSSYNEKDFGIIKADDKSETVMVEFSSPNTNKPLHLGHIRNNLLGSSISEILKAGGRKVIRVNLVNDRGIHICKSMLAWKKWGNGETPENTKNSKHEKGDHLVGFYYVAFQRMNVEQSNRMLGGFGGVWNISEEFVHVPKKVKDNLSELWEKSLQNNDPTLQKKLLDDIFDLAMNNSPLMMEAQEILRKWEAGDKETIHLWKKMNGWVYDGFAKTYKELGIEFEKTYYESETYLLGKKIVEDGLSKNVFKKKDDGSVWIDLTKDGLDEKLLLRSDGTSVYITQDVGTAVERLKEFKIDKLVYVVGNEQEYHFKVLFLILKKLFEHKVLPEGEDLGGASLFHLSYGMVDLPSGKMKSREGTVVDADDLMNEMISTAKQTTEELGKTDGFTKEESEKLFHAIGLGALKYFILKVDPKKRMLFDPKESIDFNGNTGPFIQYTYARIRSILRKAGNWSSVIGDRSLVLNSKEKELIKLIHNFPSVIQESAQTYNPGHIANYVYDLAKEYNQFYHEIPILKSEKEEEKEFRLALSLKTGEVIKTSLKLLGMDAPERM